MKLDRDQYLNRVVRARFVAINLARLSIRIADSMARRISSTFLHPFAQPALPGFIARMGALTPVRRVLRLIEQERSTTSQQVSLFISPDLSTIPPSTTVLPFPFRRFVTLLTNMVYYMVCCMIWNFKAFDWLIKFQDMVWVFAT